MKSYWDTVFCGEQLYFNSIKIISHTSGVASPFFIFKNLAVCNAHIVTYSGKKVIGYSFKTLVEIPNHFYNPRGKIEFAHIILEAIKTYYGLDDFLRIEDKNGIFKKKLEEYNIANPLKELSYNQLISSVFKDLKFENDTF